MNNAGITTQYGFLFQRKAFILFALENAGTKQTLLSKAEMTLKYPQMKAYIL